MEVKDREDAQACQNQAGGENRTPKPTTNTQTRKTQILTLGALNLTILSFPQSSKIAVDNYLCLTCWWLQTIKFSPKNQIISLIPPPCHASCSDVELSYVSLCAAGLACQLPCQRLWHYITCCSLSFSLCPWQQQSLTMAADNFPFQINSSLYNMIDIF